eukprot:211346_1
MFRRIVKPSRVSASYPSLKCFPSKSFQLTTRMCHQEMEMDVSPAHQVSSTIFQNPSHEFRSPRLYQGRIRAVILDWAGTVLDYGVFAPAVVFCDVFKARGVPISMEEARGPMGAHKKVHIRKLTQTDSIRDRWKAKHGSFPVEKDVEEMFADFIPKQLACLRDYSEMIPGAVETVRTLQKDMGLKIGSTTGFTKEMVEILQTEAAKAGYVPDSTVAADEVPHARPYPFMVWQNAINLQVSPIEAIVKVDDTADGVREGLTAGCWSVGLAKASNYVGMTESDYDALPIEDQRRKLKRSYDILSDAGAHYVVDTITDLPEIIQDINRKLALGEKP